MPFRFKRKESVKKAVRRLWCERLDDALGSVENGNNGGKFEAVHDVRKEIKKMRAILRLVRAEIGKDAYGEHTNALRSAADRMTALRDAEVKLSAFDDLIKHFKHKLAPQPFPQIKAALRKNCRTEEGHFFNGGSIASVKGILCNEKQRLDDLKIKSDGWKAVKPGLKKIYGRERHAFEAAGRDPSPENFHEWRKRVKDLGHQLRLLCPVRPRKLSARAERLDKLGDLLGDDRDLVMLRQFVMDKFGHAPNVKLFERLVSSRQKELRSEALKLGARFYPKTPRRFCRGIGRDWKSWKRKG
ncbi:MAG TPA: CHAD domain-containing protein [Candidatus Acidoferrum sp.]|nr:CHAD domain-containing protein [Candidatus Acidoferrum sp.]